jgi:hypothetical protein
MEQKDIIIVIMFILIIYCIYKINNMEKMINVDGTTDTLTVKNLKIGDGSAKTWTINTNDSGSLNFNTDNTSKWIDFNGNLHMLGDKGIHFNGKWTFKRNDNNNDWLSLYYNTDKMIDFKSNDDNWSARYWK